MGFGIIRLEGQRALKVNHRLIHLALGCKRIA
jgi:hypothetical protein